MASKSTTALSDAALSIDVASENDALDIIFQASHQDDLGNSILPSPDPNVQHDRDSVMELWSHCHLVRKGCLSAHEALLYAEFFFRNMAPLSPIIRQEQGNAEYLKDLVMKKPLLCAAILMISSRYRLIPGIGGLSRGTIIHERLWKECAVSIEEIVTCSDLSALDDDTFLESSIQALLLMVDWKPRAIHFASSCPRSAAYKHPSSDRWNQSRRAGNPGIVLSGRASDNMSWMCLSTALGLDHRRKRSSLAAGYQDQQGKERRLEDNRLRKLLFLYLEQMSLRLGCDAMTTESLRRAAMSSSQPPNRNNGLEEETLAIDAWLSLTRLLRTTSEMLSSPWGRSQVVVENPPDRIFEHLKQDLDLWRQRHPPDTNQLTRNCKTLEIEYQYTRIMLYSTRLRPGAISPSPLSNKETNEPTMTSHCHPLAGEYRKAIEEVIKGSRAILQIINDLNQTKILRFIPVRTVLRAVTASVLLLRAVSLAPTDMNLAPSLESLQSAVDALHSIDVDDIHLGPRYAVLIEAYASRVKSKLPALRGDGEVPLPGDLQAPVSHWDSAITPSSEDVDQYASFPEFWDPSFHAELLRLAGAPSLSLDIVDVMSAETYETESI
ncbi:unnamed protein product [Clonostachys rosea]|uniref:Transcription factor domain-containing protein n=1 Tax=Bionectria ochroleuca TaxID=29856 RepID=A0ABY6U3L5_BIOOC|nr:unnamed protein product [Clonostachys rosea]